MELGVLVKEKKAELKAILEVLEATEGELLTSDIAFIHDGKSYTLKGSGNRSGDDIINLTFHLESV